MWNYLKNRNFSEICPEKSISCEIASKNRNFLESLIENQIFLRNCLKTEILRKYALKNQNYLWNYLKKIKILQKFAIKIEFFCEITLENRNSSEICLGNRNLLWNYMKKSKFFGNFPWNIDFLFVKLLEKIEISRKFSYKIEIFWPGSTTPQISNQIDAAALNRPNKRRISHAIRPTSILIVKSLLRLSKSRRVVTLCRK